MSAEKTKMLAGELYDASDEELVAERLFARTLCHELNTLDPSSTVRRQQILASLFRSEVRVSINPPFFCDYGYNIELGENAYFNVNCVVLDVVRVRVGKNTLFGPGVHIYAASHPMTADDRRTGLEFGRPVSIEDDVWVGGGVIICPGVTIGAGAVVGAGSIVTRDMPSGTFAAGNPCRVIRRL
jgi:maltose O-acetyltransferase